jgi:small GTP-binding protein
LKVGGQEKLRSLWHHYYQGAEGLIFVVDSNDPERIMEAREELQGILKYPDMSNVPIVIIANKQDLPGKSYSFFFISFQKKIFLFNRFNETF